MNGAAFTNNHRYYVEIDAGFLTGPRVVCGYDPKDQSRPCWPNLTDHEREALPEKYECSYRTWAENVGAGEILAGRIEIEIACTPEWHDAEYLELRVDPHEARAVPPPRCPHRAPGILWRCDLDAGHEDNREPECETTYIGVDDENESEWRWKRYTVTWPHDGGTDVEEGPETPRIEFDEIPVSDPRYFVPGDTRLAVNTDEL